MPRTEINLKSKNYYCKDGSPYFSYIQQWIISGYNEEKRYCQKMDRYWRYHPEMRNWEKKQTYRRNREYYRQYHADRYSSISKQKREYGRNHYRENPEQYTFRSRARKCNINTQMEKWDEKDKESANLLYKFRDVLNNVHGKVMFEVDHTIPLSAGGEHHPSNLGLATKSFNSWKRGRIECPTNYLGQGVK